MKGAKVSIVILNYNGLSFTKGLLDALSTIDFDKERMEIVVVDNASTDRSSDYIREAYPSVKLIEAQENLGYAGGMNLGVQNSAGDYVLLLTNDTLPEKGWLKELMAAMEGDPAIGALGPKIYNKYGKEDYCFDGYGTTTLVQYTYPLQVPKGTKEVFEVFSVGGGCMLFRKGVVDLPFDPEYFAYSEDTYFCWLLRIKGYHNYMVPLSVLYHEGETVMKRHSAMKPYLIYLGERNRLLNMLLFYERRTLLKMIPFLVALPVLTNLFDMGKLGTRLKAYAWLVANIGKVLTKRNAIQMQRAVSDDAYLHLLSCRIFDESAIKSRTIRSAASAMNSLFCWYARLVHLRTMECSGCSVFPR